MRKIPMVVAVAVATSASAGAQSAEKTSEFRWSERIEAGHTVKITDINGAVSIRAGTGDRVEVVAVKRWRRSDPASVTIYAQRDRNGDIRVCPLYEDNESCDEHRRDDRSWRNRRDDRRDDDLSVDFTVIVPRGVDVVGASVNGPVTITGATEDVQATTVNGDVVVESGRGRLSATTVSGTVEATVTTRPTSIEFTTVNGSVIAELSPDIGADVDMTTLNGSLKSDYDIVLNSGRFNPFHVSTHIGPAGGPRMRLTTVNGNVVLRKK